MAASKSKQADDFKKIDQIKHVILRPDTYIGDPAFFMVENSPVLNEKKVIEYKDFLFCKGVERIFLEILSNAGDSVIASKQNGFLPKKDSRPLIAINVSENIINIKNFGEPIPVEPNTENKKVKPLKTVPELIFGELLTGGNFDDDSVRIGIGRNGYGAKLANIFSKYFIVKVGDYVRNQEFYCKWVDSMSKIEDKTITPGYEWKKDSWASIKGDKIDEKKNSYVEIEFELNFELFKMGEEKGKLPTQFSKNFISHFRRMALDYSFAMGISISFNDLDMSTTSIKDFIPIYFKGEQVNTYITHSENAIAYKKTPPGTVVTDSKIPTESQIKELGFETPFPAFTVTIIDTPGDSQGQVIAFVNGLLVPTGIHVNTITNAVNNSIIDSIPASLAKGLTIKAADIKKHISYVINCIIPNPSFDSQTKQNLIGPKFDIKGITKDLFKTIFTSKKWSLGEKIREMKEFKDMKTLKSTDSKVKKRAIDVKGASEANFAGDAVKSKDCVLWLTEGESASKYAHKRIDFLPGKKDYNGVYALKGKFINVQKAGFDKLSNNDEYKAIKTLMALTEGQKFKTEEDIDKNLKYGKIMIATDADEDGAAIRGLLLNLFMTKWPSLVKFGRIGYISTPAIRISDGKKVIERFYSDKAYESWIETKPESYLKGKKVKHYKGLASSTDADVKEDLTTAPLVKIMYTDESDMAAIDLAYGKDREDDRKDWISSWKERNEDGSSPIFELEHISKAMEAAVMSKSKKELSPSKSAKSSKSVKSSSAESKSSTLASAAASDKAADFVIRSVESIVNKDLAEFSFSTLFRAIPSYFDGLKKCQRQIFWHCLNHWNYNPNLKQEEKVGSLAGAITTSVNYQHGPKSLEDAIYSLANSYAGTNNVNILKPIGQFATRQDKEGPASRYVFVHLEDICTDIFNRDLTDLVPQREVEGKKVETEWIPCDLPLAVINGANGIATGWSTFIPCHNPNDVILYYKNKLEGKDKENKKMKIFPWYRGFNGNIILDEETNKLRIEGKIKSKDKTFTSNQKYDIDILETPIGTHSNEYEGFLNDLIANNRLTSYRNTGETNSPSFSLKGFIPLSKIEFSKFKKTSTPKSKKSSESKAKGSKTKTKVKADSEALDLTLDDILENYNLNLVKNLSMNNMNLIDLNGVPKKYENVKQIMDDHFKEMVELYALYKESKIEKLDLELMHLNDKQKLIKAIVIDETLKVYKRKKDDILNDIKKLKLSEVEFEKLKITDATKEKIDELFSKIDKVEKELVEVKRTKPETFFVRRLEKLNF